MKLSAKVTIIKLNTKHIVFNFKKTNRDFCYTTFPLIKNGEETYSYPNL